ncbi:MAG: GNAT family N-acetyltransferase [Flavobacteriaceae bacterium]|nr:GNAT family N-acetyltransferase [Flavobacteriaceae bacterium]
MIRKALSSEIPLIVELTKACTQKMTSEGIFQWNEHYPNKEVFQKDLERDELYVLISENELQGCITISTLKDEEYESIPWLTPDYCTIYIHRLAIHPKFQHQGLASQLMDFAENIAREKKANSVRLDTFSKNKRNQKFYEARGYAKLGNISFPKQSEFPFYCYELVLKINAITKNIL